MTQTDLQTDDSTAEKPPSHNAETSRVTPAQRVLRSVLLTICAALLVLGGMCFLSRYFHWAELINNFRAQLVAAMIFVSPFAAMLGRPKWGAAVFACGIVLVVPVAWALLPAENPKAGSNKIRVMSFNVLATNEDRQPAIDLILDSDPDIVIVIEYSNDWVIVCKQLDKAYPHQLLAPKPHGFGMAIFSKMRLSDKRSVQLTLNETDNVFLTATVKTQQQRFRLAAAHFISPVEKFKMEIRNRQIDEVTEWLKWSDVPTVFVGDFNSTPWSPYIADMLEVTNLRDSRQGFGYQATWPTYLPFPARIPIDHAFVSDEVHVSNRKVLSQTGSDHLPILIEFSISR